jgi:hypothetical protein
MGLVRLNTAKIWVFVIFLGADPTVVIQNEQKNAMFD